MTSPATTDRWAVIFTSRRRANPADGYAEAAEELARLAASMPGYLGAESVRDAAGAGITVSYWDSAEAVAAWRAHPAHATARARAGEWYESWSLRVCRVERQTARPGPGA